MAKPKRPKDTSMILNPTGKGGIHERPEDQAKGTPASVEVFAEKREQKAKLFREEKELFKENLRSIALFGTKEDSVRAKATKDILDYIAQGNPDKILEPSQEDEFGTVDDKLKQVSAAFIERSMKVSELEMEIERLKKLVKE